MACSAELAALGPWASLPFRSVLSCWPDGMEVGAGCVCAVGASCFMFWWAFTLRVRVAIPTTKGFPRRVTIKDRGYYKGKKDLAQGP